MGEWSFRPPNPIIGYTVGVEFQRPLSPPTLKRISALHPVIKRELPRRIEQQALTFQVGVSSMPRPQADIGGVVFDRLQPDGATESALSVVQTVASFMVADYSRWAEFWPRAERLLRQAIEPGLREVPIIAFILFANNRFEWLGEGEAPDFSLALRGQSRLIALHLLDCHGPCHSFHGYLATHASPRGQRVDNVLVSFSELPTSMRALDVNFNIRLALSEPITEIAALFAPAIDDRPLLEHGLESLHQLNNRLFCDVVAESILTRVPGLTNVAD